MNRTKLLVPATDNPPAKVKDEGVVNLVKAGKAAFNAKSGELLFLPEAQLRATELSSRLCDVLFRAAGAQQVGCGNDEAIRSLAERYLREWGDAATLYTDARGREIRILGWSEDSGRSKDRAARTRENLCGFLAEMLPGAGLAFVEEVQGDENECFRLLAPASAGALGGMDGFACPHCGRLFLPDSPYGYPPQQPGTNEAEQPLEDIETPGANTILGLCEQLGVDIAYTLKAMLYIASDAAGTSRPVAAFLRGDYGVSMAKLAAWLGRSAGLHGLRTAEKSELQQMIGEVAGYCGPVGLPDSVVVVCDESVKGSRNTVVGANRTGYHRKGCCFGRDFEAPVADIAQLSSGLLCPCGSGELTETILRECGYIACGMPIAAGEKGYKPLSCRDRDGTHEYPQELHGSLSIERLIIAEHTR